MNLLLKSFDETILEFSYNDNTFDLENFTILNKDVLPIRIRNNCNINTLDYWLQNRITPHGNRILQKISEAKKLNPRNPYRFLLYTHALSLTDSYWIDSQKSNLRWKDINLYANDFSQEIAEIAFTRHGTAKNQGISPEYTSHGNMKKCWYRNDKGIFLLKNDKRDPLESEVYSEFFADQVINLFSVHHVTYDLFLFKNRVTCTCPIFTSEDIGFVEAGALARYFSLISDKEKNITYEIGTINWQEKMAQRFGYDEYSDMMVIDYILGNCDRHLANYGWLIHNINGNLIGPAPLFDHGQSFFAGKDWIFSDLEDLSYWIDNEAEISKFMDKWELIDYFVQERHGNSLDTLTNFHFTNNSNLPIADKFLHMLEKFVHHQAVNALTSLESKMRSHMMV